MLKKRFVSLMVAGALMMAMGTTSAFAATTVTNPYCTITTCTQTGTHQHNGKTYAAHTATDGHTHHTNCGVSGCTQSGNHQHNGSHNSGGHGHNGQKSGGHH